MIVLLKETSISGYVGTMDLTKGGDIIRSTTYEAYLPLFGVLDNLPCDRYADDSRCQ